MPSTSALFEKLIADDRFIRWVANPELDKSFMKLWHEEHPDGQEEWSRAMDYVSLMQFKPIRPTDHEVSNMLGKIHLSIDQQSYKNRKVILVKPYLRFAASITAILLCSWFFYSVISYKSFKQEKVITQRGQKTSLILPDGSKVWLNGASKLTFSENFGQGDIREVYLEGEAFFDVKKNPDKPFLVNTQSLKIKVLGTSFNVKSYNDDAQVETALLEGKVEIFAEQSDFNRILLPDEVALFDKEKRQMDITTMDVRTLSSWRKGVLIFDQETFDSVAKRLERWYGVNINVIEGGDCRVSAKIENESLNEVLGLLKLTSRITYTVKNNNVNLSVKCK